MDYVRILRKRFEAAIERLRENKLEPGDDETISSFRILAADHIPQEKAYEALLDIEIEAQR